MSETSSLGASSAFKPQRLSATELHAKPSADYATKLATTQALLQRAAAEFQPLKQASSLGAEDVVITHLINALALDIPSEWLTMNLVTGKKAAKPGFSDKGRDVLDTFFAMPKKDQALMLELMKTRKKP